MSQKERLLEHFQNGNTITSLQAYDRLGVTQLATRIYELKQEGYPIESDRINVYNRYLEKCSVAKYYMGGK
ncbi:helix-turn-helix domain-containing protein [bacterium]|nr:helix-turn-helix domain-containing protein [bacterium]